MHRGEQIEELNSAQAENWFTIRSRIPVEFTVRMTRFPYLRPVGGTLCAGVAHPDAFKDQVDVIRNQAVSIAQKKTL